MFAALLLGKFRIDEPERNERKLIVVAGADLDNNGSTQSYGAQSRIVSGTIAKVPETRTLARPAHTIRAEEQLWPLHSCALSAGHSARATSVHHCEAIMATPRTNSATTTQIMTNLSKTWWRFTLPSHQGGSIESGRLSIVLNSRSASAPPRGCTALSRGLSYTVRRELLHMRVNQDRAAASVDALLPKRPPAPSIERKRPRPRSIETGRAGDAARPRSPAWGGVRTLTGGVMRWRPGP